MGDSASVWGQGGGGAQEGEEARREVSGAEGGEGVGRLCAEPGFEL